MKKQQEVTFKDLIGIFMPKLWIIVIVALAFGAISVVNSIFFKKDTYTSYTEVYVFQNDMAATSMDKDYAQRMVELYSKAVKNQKFLENISKSGFLADKGVNSGYIASTVRPSNIGDGIFRVSVTTEDAALSYYIALAIQEELHLRINDYIADAPTTNVFSDPRLPTVPDSKSTVKNAIITALVASILTVVVIWIVSAFDIIIHDKKKLEDCFELPVLGVIPHQEVKATEEEENVV